MNNSTRTWIFVGTLSLIFIVAGQYFGGRQGLLWTLVIALSVNSFIYFTTEFRIIQLFKGRPLEGRDPWNVISISEQLAQKARIRPPKIFIVDSPCPQAFALGRSWQDSTIVLTQGLIDSFSQKQLTAVLAYNIACIKNLSTVSFLVTSTMVQFIIGLTLTIDRPLNWLLTTKSKAITYLVSPLCFLLLSLSVSRKSYFEADEYAAWLIDSPKDLAEAIWKLKAYSATRPFQAPVHLAHIFIVNPLTTKGWYRYFHVQPNISQRITRLVGYYPI